LLIEKLDSFLGHPKVDPHGHPIPDKHGRIHEVKQVQLSEAKVGTQGVLHSVNDGSPKFLQYLSKIGIRIGAQIEIVEIWTSMGRWKSLSTTRKGFSSRARHRKTS